MQRNTYEDPPDWQPPDYATPVDDSSGEEDQSQWKPPSYATAVAPKEPEEEQPSILKKVWDKASEPLTEAPTRAADALADKIDKPSLDRSPTRAKLEGFLAGVTQGTGKFLSSLTSPLNAAMVASGFAEGVPALSSGARIATKALSAPMIAEGAKHGYQGLKDRDFNQFLTGVFEAAGGAAGALHGPHEAVVEEPPLRQSRQIPYNYGETPSTPPPPSANIPSPAATPDIPVKQPSKIFRSVKDAVRAAINSGDENANVVPHPSGSGYQIVYDFKPEEATAPKIETPIEPTVNQPPKQVVNPFEKPKPEPTRSPNLSQEFQTQVEAANKPTAPSADEAAFELAKAKFNMGKEMPEEEYANKQTKQVINPFEKARVEEPIVAKEEPKAEIPEGRVAEIQRDEKIGFAEAAKKAQEEATANPRDPKLLADYKDYRKSEYDAGRRPLRFDQWKEKSIVSEKPAEEFAKSVETPKAQEPRLVKESTEPPLRNATGANKLEQYQEFRKAEKEAGRKPIGFAEWENRKPPAKATAEFFALDEQGKPMYNVVEDGKRYTFSNPEELTKRGLEVPETPKDAVPLKGRDLREKILAEQAGKKWTPPDYAKPAEESTALAVRPTEGEVVSGKTDFTKDFVEKNPQFKGQFDSIITDVRTLTGGEPKTVHIQLKNGRQLYTDIENLEGITPASKAKKVGESKTFEQMLEEHGGSGHPESPEYVGKVLRKAGTGKPGLSVESGESGTQHVVYRGKDGNPIAAAKVVTDSKGKTLVMDLAADKTKGLLTGRAMRFIGDKLKEMGATEAAGTMSKDAENFAKKVSEASKPKAIEGEVVNEDFEKGRELGKSLAKLSKGEVKTGEVFNKKPTRLTDVRARYWEYRNTEADAGRKPLEFSEWFKDQPLNAEPEPEHPIKDITELHGGIGGIGGGGKNPPSEGPHGKVLDKLFSALEEARSSVEEQAAINRATRAKRFAEFKSIKAEGAEGAAKSLSKLRGEFEKVEPGEALGLKADEADSLFTAVKYAQVTEAEKARGYTALFKLLNGEKVPVRSELAVLDEVFGNNFGGRITELQGGLGAVAFKISKMANTMKSLQNMLSLAAPLRHGAGMLARKEFYPAFRDMFKFFGNKEFYEASMQAIKDDPQFLESRESGLFIRKPGSVSASDEEFLNSYIGEIPKFTMIPEASAASQRAYNGFLNKLDFDVYKSMTKQAKALGYDTMETIQLKDKAGNLLRDKDGTIRTSTVPTKEAKAIAKYINTATGRGDLGVLNKMTTELNTLLWSPRMMASRIQMFTNPKLYTNLPKGMRLQGLKSLLGIAAMGTIIDGLASAAGAKVSTNILSSDFMKSRFGNKVIDPWAGFQQYVVAGARFLQGKTDSKIPTNRLEIGGRFLATKESPAAALAHMILTSKFTGDPKNPQTAGNMTTQYGEKTNIYSQVGKQFVPIFVQDINDLIQSEPDFAHSIGLDTAMLGASAAGMSQDYPEKKQISFRKMKP